MSDEEIQRGRLYTDLLRRASDKKLTPEMLMAGIHHFQNLELTIERADEVRHSFVLSRANWWALNNQYQ